MEVLREFLESSTIHGLSNISTAQVLTKHLEKFTLSSSIQTKLGKFVWVVVIFLCFFCAGYLIQRSYSVWQQSPVATSITTHPIVGLDFPTVTVCPSKGSHTALNYDLMKAENDSLTEENRNNLKKNIYNIFIEPEYKEYARHMIAAANQENLRQTFEGHQSVPRPYAGSKGFEVRMWNNNGTWHTPWFGEEYGNGFSEEDKSYKVVIDIPESLTELIGNGFLMIQLDVETKENEYVEYSKGPKYQFYNIWTTWESAEAHCQVEGGQLASVITEVDREEVNRLVKGHHQGAWIGGSFKTDDWAWKWTDGSYLNFTKLRGNDAESCVRVFNNEWWKTHCPAAYPIICQFETSTIGGKSNLNLQVGGKELTFPSFEVVFINKQDPKASNSKISGFRLTWFLKHKNGSCLTNVQGVTAVSKYWEPYLLKMVQIASRAKSMNTTRAELIARSIEEKTNILQGGTFDYSRICLGDQVLHDKLSLVLDVMHLNAKFGKTGGMVINDQDIVTGFEMFSAVVYCSESVALSQFLLRLLSSQSPRTIIQATVNTIQSDDIKKNSNRNLLNQYYLSMDKIYNFQLGKILLATASHQQLDSMGAQDWPYFIHYTQEIEECLRGAECRGVRDLVHTLGKLWIMMDEYTSFRHCRTCH